MYVKLGEEYLNLDRVNSITATCRHGSGGVAVARVLYEGGVEKNIDILIDDTMSYDDLKNIAKCEIEKAIFGE